MPQDVHDIALNLYFDDIASEIDHETQVDGTEVVLITLKNGYFVEASTMAANGEPDVYGYTVYANAEAYHNAPDVWLDQQYGDIEDLADALTDVANEKA